MVVNKKLTTHQADALKRFPDEGWHRVDFASYKDEAMENYRYHTRRQEYTATLLKDKGYLEGRVKPDKWRYSFELYWEYRKVK